MTAYHRQQSPRQLVTVVNTFRTFWQELLADGQLTNHISVSSLRGRLIMKVEAECVNQECPTVEKIGPKGPGIHHRQLLECDRTTVKTTGTERDYLALDVEGDTLRCPWCDSEVRVLRQSRPEAQFALGEVNFTPGACKLLSFNNDQDPLAWMEIGAEYLARHMRGDHGHVDDVDARLNREALEVFNGQAFGRIFSGFSVNGEALWIITERSRNVTTLMMPEEYK